MTKFIHGFDIKEQMTFIDFMKDMKEIFAHLFFELSAGKWELELRKPQRTLKQNSALHLWFQLLADEMEMTGVPLKVTIGDKTIIKKWTPELVKENLFRPIMKRITGKESTAKLTTKEIDDVADPIKTWLVTTWKIIVPFPDEYEKQLLNSIQ